MPSPGPSQLIAMALDILDCEDRGEPVRADLRSRYSRLLGEIAHTGHGRRLFRRVLFDAGAAHGNRLADLVELFDQDLADVIATAEGGQTTATQSAQR